MLACIPTEQAEARPIIPRTCQNLTAQQHLTEKVVAKVVQSGWRGRPGRRASHDGRKSPSRLAEAWTLPVLGSRGLRGYFEALLRVTLDIESVSASSVQSCLFNSRSLLCTSNYVNKA